MNTILFIFGGFIFVLIIMSKLPGLEHFVKPLIDVLFKSIKFFAEHSVIWTIWLFKLLWFSHTTVLVNLFSKAEDIDPTIVVRHRNRPPLGILKEYFPILLEWKASASKRFQKTIKGQ